MSSINFKEFERQQSSDKTFTYVDLYLDIEQAQITVNSTQTINAKDIRMAYDEEAIKNSLINIFNTIPGERFLIPTFGCNLLAYVFSSVTEAIGRQIGRTILQAIEDWEPRVAVRNVLVVGNPDNNEYRINLSILVPTLSKPEISLTGVLTREGFTEIIP